MPKFTRARLIIIMIVTLALYTIASAIIIGVIVVRSNDPAQAAGDNIIWGGSHFQTEFYKFKERVTQAALDRTPEAADEVRLRYEILLNRLAIFREGQFRTALDDDKAVLALQQEVERQLLALEPAILRAADPAVLGSMMPVLKGLEQPISRLASGIGLLGGARFRDLRSEVVTQMYALGGLFLGQILTFSLLSFAVGRQVRALDRAQSSLVEANAGLSRSEAEARQARQQLYDAIESLGDPFALYDSEDRLVLCNERYRRIFSRSGNGVVPGMLFLDILREFIAGGSLPEAVGSAEEWISRRVAGRAAPSGATELQIDNRWFRRSDRRTGDGGVVTIYSDISGIKEREQRLHEQQSILQSVLDHIPIAVTMTDLDSRLVLINREAEKRYQVTAEAAIGMPAAKVVPAQLRPPTSEEDQEEVLVTGKPIIDREYTMRSDGNEERWLITQVPVFDDAGRIKFVLRAASVVPQLAQAYKELATSRALLLDAQRRAKLAYWSWEAGMGWDTLWSEEAAAVFGMAPGAVPIEGEAFHRLVHPDDLTMATLAYQALFNEGRPFQIEYRVPQRDGSVKWIRETGDVELDSDRQPARMIGTVQDITGQKQIEEKLKESQVRLRAFMDHAPMIMYLKDLEGRYQLVNKEFEQVEGVTEDQVRGRTLQELKPRASRPALAEQDREVLELGRVSIREIDDHWEPARRHLLVVKFPVRSSNGEISGIGCYAQDFTEQKRVEEDLRLKEAHLRNAQRLARIGIWQWLPETDELLWSKEALQIFGYSEEDTLQSPSAWLDRIHPDDRTAVSAKFNAHGDGRERFDLTYRIVLPDGSIRAIREEIEPNFDDSGECIGETGTVQDVTEWESTQRALRESQEQLLDAQRRAKLAYWVWDIATDRLSWSKGAPELLGVADEHLPASDSDSLRFIHADDRDRVAETYARAARDFAPYEIEYRAVRPDGQFGWFRELAETVYDESNMPLRMLGTMQDVSDQKRVEEELRQSQTDLLASQRRAQIATWQWNIGDGDFYTWSSEATQVLGLPADRLPQSDAEYVKLVVAADKRKVELAMTRAMNEHTPIDVEYRITKANGTVAWMRELSETQLDGAGKPVRMIGTVQDVTGQKRIEEALRESEAMLREAQRRAKIAAWHWDIAGGDVYTWSGEAAMVLGYQEDQLPKSAAEYLKIVHPADQDKVAEAIERTFKLQEPFEVEYRIVRSDKSVAWMRELSSIQTDDAGNPVRIIGTVQDFSEQKQLQEQLLQAQKMEAVGQLTGGIAHDFNNLLAIILGNLEIIQARADLNPAVGKRINTAISTTLRGAELTHRLLAFGRRQPLAPKATNVNELIRGLQELIRRPLGPHIDISVVEADGLWLTEVDSAQLENALLNLALNARDAMPRGGKLTIESWNVAIGASDLSGGEELDPGDYVAIAVSDSGDGMPPEVVARAFEPFFTTKGVGKGTGLGLSMVYGFVKQSGGHVKLYSELGHGTTVKILLPRLNNEQAPMAADASEERSGRGEQILVIDDEADLRELACSYLESLGYHVVSAADGLEGLATLDRMKRIDLLLTDVILPGNLDGRAIAREARKRYPDLKVLYMSGYAPQASTRSGRIDDAGLMISKPFRKSELSRKLREILDGKLQTESAKK